MQFDLSRNGFMTITNPKSGGSRRFRVWTAKRGKVAGRRLVGICLQDNTFMPFAFADPVWLWTRFRPSPTGKVYETYLWMLSDPQSWIDAGWVYEFEPCCIRCNHHLTDEESMTRGIGPECIKHVTPRLFAPA